MLLEFSENSAMNLDSITSIRLDGDKIVVIDINGMTYVFNYESSSIAATWYDSIIADSKLA